MKLETSNGPEGTATAERIQELIKEDFQGGDYIILSQADQVYFQTTGANDEFHAEYRDGGADQHFVLSSPINGSQLYSLILSYLNQEPNWQGEHQWQSLG